MRLTVNKNFNKKYLYRYTELFFNQPELITYHTGSSSMIFRHPSIIFSDYKNDTTTTEWAYYRFICNQDFIDVMDIVNNMDNPKSYIINQTLVSGSDIYRDAMLQQLFDDNIITQSQRENSKFYPIYGAHDYLSSFKYNEEKNDIYVNYSHNTIFSLDYKIDNNIEENLFFVYLSRTTPMFSENKDYSFQVAAYGAPYHDVVVQRGVGFEKNDGSTKTVVPYIALDMKSDLGFDYIDKITHIDNFSFNINFIKEYTL